MKHIYSKEELIEEMENKTKIGKMIIKLFGQEDYFVSKEWNTRELLKRMPKTMKISIS
jgi:hypothetical protein